MSDLREEWRWIPDIPYEASSFGRIRRNGRIITPGAVSTGYLRFTPCVDGTPKARYIHRAVALAFIGPCPEGQEINHKNGIKSDNRPENLEYVTRLENVRHAHRIGLIPKPIRKPKPPRILKGLARGKRHWTYLRPDDVRRGDDRSSSKLTSAQVKAIRESVAAGEMQSAVADRIGISRAQVCRIVNRKHWSHL